MGDQHAGSPTAEAESGQAPGGDAQGGADKASNMLDPEQRQVREVVGRRGSDEPEDVDGDPEEH